MPVRVKDLTPVDVHQMMAKDDVVLIDVREPAEFASERIHGALNLPLSTFDLHALPEAKLKQIVFQCGSGKRSATAVARCLAQGLKLDSHMAGGIAAWRAAGLPTVSSAPDTGAARGAR